MRHHPSAFHPDPRTEGCLAPLRSNSSAFPRRYRHSPISPAYSTLPILPAGARGFQFLVHGRTAPASIRQHADLHQRAVGADGNPLDPMKVGSARATATLLLRPASPADPLPAFLPSKLNLHDIPSVDQAGEHRPRRQGRHGRHPRPGRHGSRGPAQVDLGRSFVRGVVSQPRHLNLNDANSPLS